MALSVKVVGTLALNRTVTVSPARLALTAVAAAAAVATSSSPVGLVHVVAAQAATTPPTALQATVPVARPDTKVVAVVVAAARRPSSTLRTAPRRPSTPQATQRSTVPTLTLGAVSLGKEAQGRVRMGLGVVWC
eukprot:COSAG02_NODE_4987_length_4748_cov_3.582061_2_plen_134_part_00